MAEVEATLNLDLSAALAEIEQLSTELDDALSSASVEIEADASALDEVSSAIEELEATIEVGVEADAAEAVAAVEEIEAAAPDSIDVAVEASGAEEAQSDLAGVGEAASSSESAMEGLSTATTGFGAAAGAVSGSAEGLVGALGSLGPGGAAAAAGVAALTGATTVLFGAAVESTGSVQRFEHVFGSLASAVDSVELGDINYSLEEFAVLVGQDDEALRNAITTIGAAGQAFGVGAQDVASYSDQLVLLAGRAAVLKPGLEIGQTVEQLNRVLATGGARLARFGLDIGTVSERQDIANEIFGRGFEDLNRYEQSVVGAEAATRNLGASLERDIIAGSENVEVKLAALQQTFQNTTETLGEPLILPVFDLLQAGIPIAESLASVFASLAQASVPLVAAYAEGVAPAFEALAAAAQDLAPEFERFAPLVGELAAEFGEFGVNAIEIGLALSELFLTFADTGGLESLISLLNILNASVSLSPVGQLSQLLGGDLPKAAGTAATGMDTLTTSEQQAAQATQQFIDTALGALPTVGSVFDQTTQGIEDDFAALVAASDPSAIAANLDAMTLSILTFQSNLEALRASGEDLDATIAFIAESGPEEAGSLLGNLVDGTEEDRAALETSLENLETSTSGFSDFLAQEGADGGAGLAEQAALALSGGAGAITATADAAGDAAATGLGSGFSVAVALIQGQMALVQGMLIGQGVALTSTARAVGAASGLALGQAFGIAAPVGVTIAMGVVQAQISSSGSALAGSARAIGSQIGVALGQGITSGIQTQVGSIAAAAAQAVNTAEQAARNAADANSPSKLFAALGADMGDGIAVGLARAQRAVVAEAEALTFAAAGGAAGDVNVGGVAVYQTINGNAGDPRTMRRASHEGLSAGVAKMRQRTRVDVKR